MKTKHLFFTAILLLSALFVSAEPVDPMRALETAEQFLPKKSQARRIKSKTTPEQSYEIVYTHRMPNSDRAAFYVVKLGEKGFVIISADDVANPILGYSYTNSWPTSISAEGDTILPPQVLSYLNDMALQIETAIEKYPNLESSEEWNNVGQKTVRKTPARKSADALPDSVGPLLTTTWGQGQYYNALCPEDANGEDGHVQTGCVATAMAQIINYWGQKEEIKTRGIHSYDSQYGNLTVNYDSTSYDFANMPDALTAESTPEQINAVAKLMYECGVAVNMLYSTWESASLNEDARAALINFYHFTPDLSIAERAYFSSVEWDNLLHNDIAQGKPVYYSGAQNNLGHSFVCDGYNATGYYHFNFGWEGLADGWYLTSAVSPIGMDFSSNQLVLVGIVPDNTSNIILGQTMGNSVFNVDEPLEFYHLLGHNAYEGSINRINSLSTTTFSITDKTQKVRMQFLSYEPLTGYNLEIYDGENLDRKIRSLNHNKILDLSTIDTETNAVTFATQNVYTSFWGFRIRITNNNACCMASDIITVVDSTSIMLEWKADENTNSWEIEYGLAGFEQGTGTSVICDTSMCTIRNLLELTKYDIYVRSICTDIETKIYPHKVQVYTGGDTWEKYFKKHNKEIIDNMPDEQDSDSIWEKWLQSLAPYGIEIDNNIVHISSSTGLTLLKILLDKRKDFGTKRICLTNDIDLFGHIWEPINNFSGTLDGGGHTIKNLFMQTYESGSGYGLLAAVDNFESIFDINISNAYINAPFFAEVGILIGKIDCTTKTKTNKIYNCTADGTIIGYSNIGGLVGSMFYAGSIINSMTNTMIIGSHDVGGICGLAYETNDIIYNCYVAGKVVCKEIIDNNISASIGLIIGRARYMSIAHCYANIFKNNIDEIGIIGTIESAVEYSNNTYFGRQDTVWHLFPEITINTKPYSRLLSILNLGVELLNDSTIKTWDNGDKSNNYLPKLGGNYTVSCPNISNLKARNIIDIDNNYAVEITWDGSIDADFWELKYTLEDSQYDSIVVLYKNPDTLRHVVVGKRYTFAIRQHCDSNNCSAWSNDLTFCVDKKYWTDVVTTQPEGYSEDSSENVHISSPEGMAWLISMVNGLNGMQPNNFEGKIVFLENDIDIGSYKWTALSQFNGNFNGNNFSINGLYVNELEDFQGLFGKVENSCLNNIKILNCYVKGKEYVGALAGYTSSSQIINCHVEGSIYAESHAGGIVGSTIGENSYEHTGDYFYYCSSHGIVQSIYEYAAGISGAASEMYNCFSSANVSVIGMFGAGGLLTTLSGTMVNSYSTGNVNGYMYNGGLVADMRSHSSIVNCYATGIITGMGYNIVEGPYDGGLVGVTGYNDTIRYAYAREDYVNHPLIGNFGLNIETNRIISDTASLAINDSIFYLLNSIEISNKSYTNLLDALNAWVDANNSEGQYLHWVADTAGVNGGFPIFAEEDTRYIITFCNDDGTILQQDTLELGEMPEYRGGIPTKDSTEQYNYTFIGWDQEVVPVTKDVTYYAQYEETINQYEINFYDWDGTLLQSSMVNYGEWPTYYNSDPWRDADAQYTYTFSGWSPELSMVTGHQSYYAQYTSTLNQYEINFYDWDGTLLQSEWVNYGEMLVYTGATPTHESNAQYTYTFTGWSPQLDWVTGTASYYAQYEATLNQYEVTFYNWDGNVLQSTMVNYGELPSYNGVTPTRESDAQYTYTFTGWSPELSMVTGTASYYAQYEETLNQYEINFYDWDGSVLYLGWDYYGDYPFYGGATPTRESDAQYTYTFTGWSPQLDWVTGTASYYAQYEETLNQYEVTFYDWNGELLYSSWVNYGEMPSYTGITPTRESDAQYTYTFTGWSPELSVVTGAQSYTAQYEATLNQYEVTFYNWDGTLLQSTMVNYGELPSYTGITPARDSDAQYTYTFTGWSQELVPVTKNVTYHAQYEATINQYEINFYDWDGTLLQSTMVNYGELPSYTGITPTRESNAQYTYTFTSWSPELSMVTGTASYYAQYEATLNQYEVTFYDWNGEVLQSTMVNYGEMPSYNSATPTREADAQHTYTFTGWGDMSIVTGNQSYTAQYESTLNQYEVTFYNWNGEVLQSTMVNYGEMPSYTGITPTRDSDAQYTYTFNGWSPELSVVTGAQSYTAQYESTLNQYEVTFLNWDGSVLQSSMVNYGEMPSYNSATPTREADAQYTYTFTGWGDMSVVTGAQSYTAQYESTLNQYEVTFLNWDGSVLQSSMVNYGEMPSYNSATPTRESDAQYTYTFTGWSPQLDWVTGTASYYTQYEATLNQYEVIFYNWNGEVLQSTMVNYGELPAYAGITPTRESNAQYTYIFTGWGDMSIVTGNQSYTAQYEAALNQYEVTFYNWDGNVLQSTMVNYGELPSYTGITPTREADAQYTYTFTGWGDMSVVTGAQSYTAQYESTLNQYEVTFYDWNGEVLQSTMVNYGELPSYNGATPTRESDAQYTYTFTGWSPELSMVTGTASYYAQYEATLNQYEVTFLNWDGSVLQSSMVNYGEMPSYTGITPTHESDAQYTYTFNGWSPELSMVTGTASYYAQYEATLNQYEVIFYNWNGEVLQSTMVNYGEVPSYNGVTPTRESDAQYTYTFTGWSPELSVVTSNQSYTAQYEAILNQYEVTFLNWDGSVLQSSMVNYGELPAYEAATPTKPEDEHYVYTFFGWEPEITIVISEAEYTAQYEATEKTISSVDNAIIDQEKPHKVFIDGKLFIIHGEHIYSGQGHQIK